MEMHSTKSYVQTKDEDWLKINNQARIDRTELLEKIADVDALKDGENWCFLKHSLVVMGGYIELGNREYTKGNIKMAKYYFEKFSLWLGIFLIKSRIKGGKK